ncbi:MAG: GAF domain-containing protein [Anaerolineaceae bacterium]|nr:GAF domain-containing protein [Anaerolineaceae bacterium]
MNYFSPLNPSKIPASIDPQDPLLVIRERILHQIFIGLCVLGIFGYPLILSPTVMRQSGLSIIFYSFVYFIILLFTFLRGTPYNLRVSALAVLLLFAGALLFIKDGLNGYGIIFMVAFAVLLTGLVNMRTGVESAIAALLITISTGWLMSTGRIAAPTQPGVSLFNPAAFGNWLVFSGFYILVTAFFISLFRLLFLFLEQTIQKQINLTSELKKERNQLDDRIHQRTSGLQKRALQLEVAGLIARDITIAENLDELLNHSVQLIKERFNFYHAGLFLLDEKREYAILKAATGEAGRRMLESNYMLKTGATGIVGYVVAKGEAHIALEANLDEVQFKNPLLSQTRSEMALPLKVGSDIIGALDIQSVEENAFGYEDVQTLQTIADQLAVSIDKAKLILQMQETIKELEASNSRDISKSWRSFLKSTRREYAYSLRHSVFETETVNSNEARDAILQGRPIVAHQVEDPESKIPSTIVAIPIKLRSQVLGVMELRFANVSISEDLINLLEITTNRLALALENARLLEELQIRAGREHMVSEVSAKLRTSTDIDSILRTAAVELGRALNTTEVLVQLRPVDQG